VFPRFQPIARIVTLAAIAVVAVYVAPGLARQDPSGPHAVLTQATGDLRLDNSLSGHAIFQLTGLAPGDMATGTVKLSNSGGSPGDLGLRQLNVLNVPGVNGGILSNAVNLEITDISGGNSVPVFAGKLGLLSSQSIGAIGPGSSRTFRFRAALPDNGIPAGPTSGDNAFKGSKLTMSYAWTATQSGPIGGSGGNGGGGNGGGGGTSTPPKITKFKVDKKRLQKKGWLDVYLACNRTCNWSIDARGIKSSKHVRFKTAKVTMPVPNKLARVRMKLTKKGRKALKKVLKRRTRKPFYLQVWLTTTVEGKSYTFKKKAKITRPVPKKKRKRR
jgi:hypothetical protein